VAAQRAWSFDWIVEQCKAEVDRPTICRVLEGARVEGHWKGGTWVAPHWDTMAEVIIPYQCLIDLYVRAIRGRPALPGEKACACGCGVLIRGKKKWARPGCKKRIQRQSETRRKAAA
jgi:hypothetical protein